MASVCKGHMSYAVTWTVWVWMSTHDMYISAMMIYRQQ